MSNKARYTNREKMIFVLAGCLAVIGAVGTAGLVLTLVIRELFMSIPPDDPEPPYDDDLRIELLDIPNEENAYYYFKQALEKLEWPEDKDELIDSMLDGTEWDQDFVDDLLNTNAQVFELFEQGLACERSQILEAPRYEQAADIDYADCKKLGKLVSLRAWSLFRHGEEKRAFDEAMKLAACGQMIQSSRGSLVQYFCGAVIRHACFDCIIELINDTTLGATTLRNYSLALDEYRPNEDVLANVLRREYSMVSEHLDRHARQFMNSRAGDPKSDALARKLPPEGRRIALNFVNKPNRSKRKIVNTYRSAIADLGKHWNQVWPLKERSSDRPVSSQMPTSLRVLLRGNMLGEFIFVLVDDTAVGVLLEYCDGNARVTGLQLLIALKCYNQATGQLPDGLDELIPEYIDAVPIDPFDGGPTRYSRARKIVYFVGPGVGDAGGGENTKLPWVFKIGF